MSDQAEPSAAARMAAILGAVEGRKAAERFIVLKAYLDSYGTAVREALAAEQPTWNRWAPDALSSPVAPAHLVEAYNRWQPDHLKIRREQS
jgi:hypothetical protein